MSKKISVKVTLKKGVLDPQGKAIEHALGTLGFQGVENVTQGKLIEMDVADSTTDAQIKEMCEQLLANPVIEDYEIKTA